MTELSEEEKKAIERANEILKEWQKIVDIEDDIERDIEMSMYSEEMPFHTMKILLNLIQNQDTEINKLNNVIDRMATDIKQTNKNLEDEGYCVESFWLDKEGIKEYFMKEE